MMRLLGLALAVGGAVGLAGCFHYTADVPGVLDLRSDGSQAAPNEEALVAPAPSAPGEEPPALRRDGVAAILEGDGVVEQGTRFTLEDRHWFLGATAWFPGLFLTFNDSSAEELDAALGGQALRNLRLGHKLMMTDVLLTVGVGLIPVVGTCASLLVAPRPWTFTASGERVRTASLARKPAPEKPEAPPPAPPSEDAVPVPGVEVPPPDDGDGAEREAAADGEAAAEAPPGDRPEGAAPAEDDK